ncbi:MAG: Peptidase, partial [Anaerolineales bacterium]|nr:Peptidase [Anaerolineales bacterium]
SDMLGIPAVLAGLSHNGSRAHAPNEHIRLKDYWLGQKFIGEFIRAFAE